MHATGVETRPLREINGETNFSEVFLTGVRVPEDQRVGDVNHGWRVGLTTLMNERVSIGGNVEARNAGPIGIALEVWKRSPHRHGPIWRDRLTRLWIENEVLRLGALRAQQQRAKGTPGPEGSVLKLGSSTTKQRIAVFVADLQGTQAMLRGQGPEAPAEQLLLSPRWTIAGGTSDVMRNILGERVLGLPAEAQADRHLPWSQVPR